MLKCECFFNVESKLIILYWLLMFLQYWINIEQIISFEINFTKIAHSERVWIIKYRDRGDAFSCLKKLHKIG